MSAPAVAGGPVLTIRGTQYPVLLPKFRDPRLHLAAVIITLQVLGQTAFGFSLSIAQILVAIGTCAVLEIGIAFFRQHVVLWPASALLTGNGVAFILRVPGTPHGDWWSLHGAWIFAATAAVSLLSKHLIRWRGRHIFNPSNFGLVLCFLVLGKTRAEPLDFWWGPMSLWLALAIALIVAGGLTILSRLRLLIIAGGFWLAFAAGIGVLAASGHSMTARWHLGPITGWSFWWLLVTSPEVLIFLFFMITDPMTIPKGRVARVVYSVCVGLLATLLIAPQTTEYATKVAVLSALALVCAARPLLERLLPAPGSSDDHALAWGRGLMRHGWVSTGALALAAAAFAGLVVVAGIPARIAHTGYTGEDGFEVYVAPEAAETIWQKLLQAGGEFGIRPCGLGARNTLRLEAKMALYGHEITASINPYEADLGWIVKMDKGEFVGRTALEKARQNGVTRKLVGFEMKDRGIGRDGYEVWLDGKPAGWVTSGGPAPTLNANIGLCYLPVEKAVPGVPIQVMIRNAPVSAVTVATPFYKRAKS